MPETIHPDRRLGRLILLTGLAISLAISSAYLVHPAVVRSTNNRTTDAVMALASSKPTSGSVVIVDIDDHTLAHYGQWPWPRYRLAQLLGRIDESGAASIGLALILAEPDRTSPNTLQNDINRDLGYRIDTSGIPHRLQDNDRILASTLGQGPFVLGYEFMFRNGPKQELPCGLHAPGIAWVNKTDATLDQSRFFNALGVVCNRQLFSRSVHYSGFLNATPDADGILRKVPMLIRFEDRLYPSLSLAMLMQFGQSSQIGILQRGSGRLDLIVDSRTIPVDTQGNMLIQFSRRADAVPRVSAGDILGGKIPADRIKNKIVLVGSSAAGLTQAYNTTVSPLHTPLDLHTQVIDNVLTRQMVIRTAEFTLWETLFGLLVAALSGLAIARLGILQSSAVCLAILAGTWLGSGIIFQARGYLFSPLLPTTLVALNFAALTILKSWKIQLAARKGAESTLILLKSSEKNLDSIIKAVPDIIFRLDPEGRITFISPAISKYAAAPDALIGRAIFDLVAPDDLPKARYRLNEKRTGQRATHDLELRLLLPHKQDGNAEEVGHFSISAEGIYQGETPSPEKFIGTQGIIHDITEQKKLEEKLLHAQKMEAIGNLAAGVAHDLNNILAGLVSYPDLLLLEMPPDSPLRDKMTVIQRSGQRAAAIVQDLLTLARRGVKTGEVVSLNSVITDFLTSPEFEAARKHHPGTSLEIDLASDLMFIKGSKVHLAKAIMNILNNAAEAMPAGGLIKLASYNSYLDTPLTMYEDIPPGEYVCVSVTDEGVGIAAEDIHRIFEPFYTKKSMQRSGSGLGMTVIWATVKDHGGYIDLQSQEGEGTRIVLYLPATRDQEEIPSPRIVLENYIGTERVLIVDDMPEQLQIASNMLTKLGYTVTAAASGEAAVDYLSSNTADLVLLDMIMPGGLDGLETFQQIIRIRPGQKAIITSGFSESDRVKALQKLGAGTYVQKPYTLEKLGVAVRRELDRS